jgi:hypothetical protein
LARALARCSSLAKPAQRFRCELRSQVAPDLRPEPAAQAFCCAARKQPAMVLRQSLDATSGETAPAVRCARSATLIQLTARIQNSREELGTRLRLWAERWTRQERLALARLRRRRVISAEQEQRSKCGQWALRMLTRRWHPLPESRDARATREKAEPRCLRQVLATSAQGRVPAPARRAIWAASAQ